MRSFFKQAERRFLSIQTDAVGAGLSINSSADLERRTTKPSFGGPGDVVLSEQIAAAAILTTDTWAAG